MLRTVVPRGVIEAAIGAMPDSQYDMLTLNDRYVGRGMYGDGHCFGVVGNQSAFLAFMIELAVLDVTLARQLAFDTSTDSMGRSTIFYFRRYQLSEGGS